MRRRLPTPLLLWHRFVAATCVALVLTLAILAASPEAHELCHADADHEDHTCAVVLFSHGLTVALDIVVVPPPECVWQRFEPTPRPTLFLIPPRYLRQPERGPPTYAGFLLG